MKRIILIISSILYFSSSTELHEILRLPLLIEHYSQHRLADPQLSLPDFLKIHYSEDHPNDKDNKDDNELPFKSQGSLAHIDTPIPPGRVVLEKTIFSPSKKKGIRYIEAIPDNTSFSIFHPPRFA